MFVIYSKDGYREYYPYEIDPKDTEFQEALIYSLNKILHGDYTIDKQLPLNLLLSVSLDNPEIEALQQAVRKGDNNLKVTEPKSKCSQDEWQRKVAELQEEIAELKKKLGEYNNADSSDSGKPPANSQPRIDPSKRYRKR